MNRLMLAIVLLLLPAMSSAELSPRLQDYMEIIERSGEEVKSVGDVLEILYRETFFRGHPDDSVFGNIMYVYNGRVIGELDMMLALEPRVDMAPPGKYIVWVCEMKLWNNLPKALAKARRQLLRYRTHLKNNLIDYYVQKHGKRFHIFRGNISPKLKFITVGPRGAKKHGFDREFDITPSEGLEIFREIYKYRTGEDH